MIMRLTVSFDEVTNQDSNPIIHPARMALTKITGKLK